MRDTENRVEEQNADWEDWEFYEIEEKMEVKNEKISNREPQTCTLPHTGPTVHVLITLSHQILRSPFPFRIST